MRAFIYFIPFVALLAACQSGQDRQEMASEIQGLEQQIGQDAKTQADLFGQLMDKYVAFAQTFPEDTASAGYLSKAAELARLNQEFDKAIGFYDQIMEKYEGSSEASKAMFMKGFTLDNDLKDTASAKAVYEAFLQKYPTDDFADDTEFLLKNLGKTEEEIIRQFEEGQ